MLPDDSVKPKVKAKSVNRDEASVREYSGKYKSAGEYANALRLWMTQVHQIQCVSAGFPYFLASLHAQSTATSATTNSSSTTQQNTTSQQQQQSPQQNPQQQQGTNNAGALPRRGIEFHLPPIWKRVVAESIDFLLLLVIKLGVTYAAVDTFDLLEDVDKYDLESLGNEFLADYRMALNMTSEILFLELIHRIGTCFFEALCLHRGPGGMGGATPGKRMMGLRVVRCEWLAPTNGNQAVIYPSGDLGIGRAFVRSVVKNFLLTFLFPLCFTLFSFPHHSRTVYDSIAGSVVIEERPVLHPNPHPNNNNNNNLGNNNNVNAGRG